MRSLALVAFLSIASTACSSRSTNEQADASAAASDPGAVTDSLRSLRRTLLAMPAFDGSRTAVFPPSAATSLRPTENAIVADIPSARARLELPKAAHEALKLTTGGVSIGVRARGAAAVNAQLDDNALVYRDAFRNADLMHVPLEDGDEEFVVLREPPNDRSFSWELSLGAGAAGLRLVGDTLEVLDSAGVPRVHVGQPTVFDADGRGVRASLDVEGCAVDRSPTVPTDHPVTRPGAERCVVVSRFDDTGLRYPLVFDPAWTSTTSMAKARRLHQMVSYKTSAGTCAVGCPMVLGGMDSSTTVLNTTEIYLPTGVWSAMSSMPAARQSFAAVNFASDRIVVAGGSSSTGANPTMSVYVYNIPANTWSSGPSLLGGARMGLTGASVQGSSGLSGLAYTTYAQAIFVGGWDGVGTFTNKVDAYTDNDLGDSTAPTMTGWTPMATARAMAAVAGYDQGCGITVGCTSKRYFTVAGGRGSTGALASIEYAGGTFSTTSPSWTAGGTLGTARWGSAVAQMPNGGVMYLGGGWGGVGTGASEVSMINLANGAATLIGNLSTARGGGAGGFVQFSSTYLPVFTGGAVSLSATSYGERRVDIASMPSTIFPASQMVTGRLEHTAHALSTGGLLVAGGYYGSCVSIMCTVATPRFLSTAEVFAPTSNGSACTERGDCASTFCTDGVCCNADCKGQCQACNLPSALGTCTTVTKTNGPAGYPAGQAVSGFGTTRSACAPFGEPCGYACDGTSATACSLPLPRPTCIAASCTGTTQTNPATCDSSGTCPTPSVPTKDCTPFACGATACRTTCSDNTHCAPGYKCSGGTCVTTGGAGAACTIGSDCSMGLSCVDGVCCDSSSCPSGMKCNNAETPGTCRYPNGAACTTSTAALCASGNCVDGYCCNSTCTGQCQACDVAGKLGQCIAVAGDPHGTRTKCVGSGACQAKCDGVNGFSCGAPPAVSTVCAAGFCSGGAETPTRYCDGLGTCISAASKSCVEYKCGTTTCLSACSSTTDCAAGYTCIGGSCVTTGADGTACSADDQCTSAHCVDGVCCKTATCGSGLRCNATTTGTCAKPIGATCAADTECGSGNCIDGVCCSSRCTGQCEACNVAGSEGSCIAVAGSPRGSRTACTGTGACQASCDGTIRTSCAAVPGSSTTCEPASCDGTTGIAKPAAYCDGAGNCTPAKATACKPYTCDATACKTVCVAESDCATGYTCKENACVPKAGIPCTSASDCTSGFCVDNVCCNTACAGQCEACDIAGAIGTCSPAIGAPHGARAACSDGGGSVCRALACDGSDRTKCVAYANGPDKVCEPANCMNGTLEPEAVCDGKGTCKATESTSCAPYVCDGSNKCKTSCATSADCASGFLCASGTCSAITAKCKDDGTASVPLDGSGDQPCNGFLCDPSSGRCRDTCSASTECQSGYTCDGNKCIATAAPGGDVDDGGGCAVNPTRRTTIVPFLALLALGALARRRRQMPGVGG